MVKDIKIIYEFYNQTNSSICQLQGGLVAAGFECIGLWLIVFKGWGMIINDFKYSAIKIYNKINI